MLLAIGEHDHCDHDFPAFRSARDPTESPSSARRIAASSAEDAPARRLRALPGASQSASSAASPVRRCPAVPVGPCLTGARAARGWTSVPSGGRRRRRSEQDLQQSLPLCDRFSGGLDAAHRARRLLPFQRPAEGWRHALERMLREDPADESQGGEARLADALQGSASSLPLGLRAGRGLTGHGKGAGSFSAADVEAIVASRRGHRPDAAAQLDGNSKTRNLPCVGSRPTAIAIPWSWSGSNSLSVGPSPDPPLTLP